MEISKRSSDEIIDYDNLLKFYDLKNLVRYNQRLRIKDETVAEHSYYVALFSSMICDQLGLSADNPIRSDSLRHALYHDLPEVFISDVPYSVKRSDPSIRDALDRAETSAVAREFPEYKSLYEKVGHCETDKDYELIWVIVKTADVLSVIQYSTCEIRLGNKTLIDVLDDGINRYIELHARIKSLTGKSIKF